LLSGKTDEPEKYFKPRLGPENHLFLNKFPILHGPPQDLVSNDRTATAGRVTGALADIRIGDTLSIETKKGSGPVPHSVIIGGYTTPLINISAEPTVTPKQRHMLRNW
jgi:hypothetical protein